MGRRKKETAAAEVRVWGWDAKARQITDRSKVGDRVYVGYLADNDPHNYQLAVITRIRPVVCYPNGLEGEKEIRYQVWVRFDDGRETCW